jgi:DNA-binding MarR family transcriptional regulator
MVNYISMAFKSAAMSRGAAPSMAEVHAAIECLARLAEVYRRRREKLAESVGLSDPQWGVMEEIATEHFMPSLFARDRESSAAAVSKILRQLLDKGLIVASIAKADGRQRHYSLTARGKRVMDRLRESRAAAVRDVWLTLDREAMNQFTEFGKVLFARLDRYTQPASSEKE